MHFNTWVTLIPLGSNEWIKNHVIYNKLWAMFWLNRASRLVSRTLRQRIIFVTGSKVVVV